MARGDSTNFTNTSGGSSVETIIDVVANTTLTYGQNLYRVNASSGNIVLTLPTISNTNKGLTISITRTDNSTNSVAIVPATLQKIGNKTESVYLFSQNNAIVLKSSGVDDSMIISANRDGLDQTRNFLHGTLTAPQTTNLAAGNHIKFNQVFSSRGNNITLDTTTPYTNATNVNSLGRFLLKANQIYRLTFNPVDVVANGGYMGHNWHNSDTNQSISNLSFLLADNSNNQQFGGAADTVFAPTVDTRVELRINEQVSLSSIGAGTALRCPTFYIEQITTSANVINTVDSALFLPTNSTLGQNTDITLNAVNGNINVTNGTEINLLAGKEYLLTANLSIRAKYAEYDFVDASNVKLPSSSTGWSGSLNTSDGGAITAAVAKIRPTQNQVVKLRTNSGVSLFNSFTTGCSSVTVVQIGSSSAGTVTGATSTTNGVQGVVPAPVAGQENAIFKNNGWQNVESGTLQEDNTIVNLSTYSYNFTTTKSGVLMLNGKINMYGNSANGFSANILLNGLIVQRTGTNATSVSNAWFPCPFSLTSALNAGNHTLTINYVSGGGGMRFFSLAWILI